MRGILFNSLSLIKGSIHNFNFLLRQTIQFINFRVNFFIGFGDF
jgi:hypothetical protein